MRNPRASGDPFAPNPARVTAAERVVFILLLVVAGFLRTYRLFEVPPGIHDDEIINAQIADRVRMGTSGSIFYAVGEGREGLYHPLLVASRALTGRVPYWYRLPSVGCSLVFILLVHRLSRRWFGPWTALVTVGGLAVTFWPVHLGREALRVVTFPPLAAGLLLALWRGLERPTHDGCAIWWFVLAGVLLGLGQYSYLAARVLPVFVVLLPVYLACFHRGRLSVHWRGFVLALTLGALIAAPLVVHLAMHWEEQERVGRLDEPLRALLAGDPYPVLTSTSATLGMFVWRGDPQPHYNLPGQPVFGPVGSILFVAGVLIALFQIRHPASACCLLWTAVALVPGMLTQPSPHFVRTAGSLVTAFIFPGVTVGWVQGRLAHPRARSGDGVRSPPLAVPTLPPRVQIWRSLASAHVLLGVAAVVLLCANISLIFRDYFHRWPNLDDVRGFRHAGLAEVARYLDQEPDTTPLAVCTPFLNEAHFFWRSDRQALPYLLNRQDLDIGWYSCRDAQLFPQGGQVGRYMFGSDRGLAPFVPPGWGERVQTVASFHDDRLIRLELADQLEGWLAQFTPAASGRCPDASCFTFGGVMTFVGHRIQTAPAVPGGVLEMLTAWRVVATPPYDLAIFVHLLDSGGSLVAQGDALSALSDTFHPGDVFLQRHTVALPSDMPLGDFRLMVGLYVRGDRRLPLDSGEGESLILGTAEIRDGSD